MMIMGMYLACFAVGAACIHRIRADFKNPPMELIVRLGYRGSPLALGIAGGAGGLVLESLARELARQPLFEGQVAPLMAGLAGPVLYAGLVVVGVWNLHWMQSRMGRGGALLYLRWLNRGDPEPFDMKREMLILKAFKARAAKQAERLRAESAPTGRAPTDTDGA